ncbi:MAG: heme exporter protein CcmB [Armatimonadota bacterium]|nr:heme exporter protein CcmB [Armatimonadota bacterium]
MEPRPKCWGGVSISRHWITCAWTVFRKDLQVELRTRYALGAVLLFAVTTLIAVSAALSSILVHSEVKAALLWIVLLFAALSGLARVFVREEEAGTAPLLRLSAPATAVYAGKWLFNIALVFAVESISVPLFLVVLPVQDVNYGLLFGVLALGGIGLAGAATFVAALIAQASSGKSALFFIVAFPVLMPLLLIAVQGTIGAFDTVTIHQAHSRADIGMLAVYSVVMTTASFLLFEHIWHD